jgi:hypothetical protein
VRKLARVGIALIGFWVFTSVPNLLTFVMGELPYDGSAGGGIARIAGASLPALAAVLIGLLLIVYGRNLADWLFADSDVDLDMQGQDLVRAGCVLLGVSMIAFAVLGVLSNGIYTIGTLVGERMALDGAPDLSNITMIDWLPALVADAIRLGLGLFLVIRAEWLAMRLWAGRPVAPVASDDLPRCPQCGAPYDPEDYEGGVAPARCVECGQEIVLASHLTSASS